MRIAQAAKKIFGCCSNWKNIAFSLLQFNHVAKPAKRLLKLTKHSKLSSFTNMITKIDLDNSGGSRKFWWRGDFKHKPSKIRMSSPKTEIRTFFPPKIRWSPKIKKKKVFTEIESDFSAETVSFTLVGGDASRNGA